MHPPVAKKVAWSGTCHGDTRHDEYHWLRNREDPDTVPYLQAENAHTEAVMAPEAELREQLFEELKARILPEDQSVPEKIDDWFYYSRDVAGAQYPVYCRKQGSLEAAEQVILDLNHWASGQDFLELGVFEISPDHRYLAFSFDHDGSEHYTLRVLEIGTGQLLPEQIADTSSSAAWALDSRTLFVTLLDAQDRPDRVLRHRLGEPHAADQLVYRETDPRFFVDVDSTRSREYVVIHSSGKITSEAWFLPARQPQAEFRCVEPRREGVEYAVDHLGEEFLILTNVDQCPNFRILSAPVTAPGRSSWKERLAHDSGRYLVGLECFEQGVVVSLREKGLSGFLVLDPRTFESRPIRFDEAAYDVSSLGGGDWRSPTFRFAYQSMTRPPRIFDCAFQDLSQQLRKERKVPGYDPGLYRSERSFARSPDGTEVPVCLVYRHGTPRDGTAPVVLYGYGAYGASTDPTFSSARISLLDRGFVWAIAQIRGGSELGRHWYDDGKFLKKQNSFTDFASAAEHLIAAGWARPGGIAIVGGSAGGLLVGAVLNQRPGLFRAAVALVPFVDVVNTMLDDSLPLTPLEYDEWGNPAAEDYYRAMRAYSPYDNVSAQVYPHLLITAGLNDPRVTYWEPAKWCARLRDRGLGDGLLLLHTEMGAGHGGASGRYDSLKEWALIWAFLLKAFSAPSPAARPHSPGSCG